MNLLNFVSQYPDEASCRTKFKEFRDKQGVVCPRCGGKEHYWKKDKENYECKHCGKRQSLRANTVMHGSQLPFRYWFIAIHLLTSTKKSFSAAELQRQLGHKRYAPIWELLHKLRLIMGKRDELYTLSDVIELDEGFFSTEIDEDEKDKPLKRGRGSQKKSKVLVMAESKPVEGKMTKTGKPRQVGHLKMIVIDDLKSDTINPLVEKNVSDETTIDSDDSTSYVKLKDIVKEHRPQVIPKEKIGTILPWVHIAISNAKRMLLDIFHDIKPQYLQNYLNEFCYKFNRRYFGENLFDRLMIAAVAYKNNFRSNNG
ncbi:IS1595 family transposase [Paludibacter sp. 221]|uniref:IS1595 family transposase n=1 Tax=Paludibacter sp. 221 TaxID=2302939 RepID=UPI0013D38AE6|nr:IS1595 family transposase [Paludibacter sp. 221]NDV46198.1 IS1595 family transposase [Paludibacter sp. 221]